MADPEILQTENEKDYGISRQFVNEVLSALESGNKGKIKQLIKSLHFADLADLIDIIKSEEREKLIELTKDFLDPEILVELDSDVRQEVLDYLGVAQSAEAILNLATDDAIEIIKDLDEKEQKNLLEAFPEKERAELEESLAYPEDSAGRLLEKNVVSVPEFWTVGQTIDFLRANQNLPDEFNQIFVVNPKFEPVGGVTLSKVIKSQRDAKMNELMERDIKTINPGMDQEEVAYIFKQYDLVSAPVVNEQGKMIGLITLDDIVDVVEEEAQEDIMLLGGILETDIHSNLTQTIKRRFPWLMVNLVTAVLASIVIGMFEGAIAKLAALAVLMPINASMGGNAGTQALTVAVRAIATREITEANVLRVVVKELFVGSLNGMLFALVAGVVAYLWYHNIQLSLIFAFATMITLFFAGIAGVLVPLGLTKIGVDPAVASSVFVTTVTDIVGFGSFLAMASLLLV